MFSMDTFCVYSHVSNTVLHAFSDRKCMQGNASQNNEGDIITMIDVIISEIKQKDTVPVARKPCH